MTQVRIAVGLSLHEAMKRRVEIKDYDHLMSYLDENFFYWKPFKRITQQFYARDSRINWRTWLICIDGKAALFVNGKFPDDRLEVVTKWEPSVGFL